MRNRTKGWLLFAMFLVLAYTSGGSEILIVIIAISVFAALLHGGMYFLHKEDDIKFHPHTTIELGTTINITDGPYKGVWEATQGGWRKI